MAQNESQNSPSTTMASCIDEVCWICHSGAEEAALERPCPCPRVVHRACMGRWQLERSGSSEECSCRFCGNALPPLEEMLLPSNLLGTKATPSMTVKHNGQLVKIPLRSGAEGLAELGAQMKRLIGAPDNYPIELTVHVTSPGQAPRGFSALKWFNAMVACAAADAAKLAAEENGGSEGDENRAE